MTMPTTCDAKIRPFPSDLELTCDLDPDHDNSHQTVVRNYARPGSSTGISWDDGDRRSYRGVWQPCPAQPCVLPAGHYGNHAP